MSGDHPSGWEIHSETAVYDSPWVRLAQADVTGPHGYHVPDHHVIRMRPAAGALILVDDRVLLMWRHRFITRRTGWEIPAGRIEDGEAPVVAAARECFEETGWRPGPMSPWLSWSPLNGIADSRFHCFMATSADHVGEPLDAFESEHLAWKTRDEVRDALVSGAVHDGFAVPALWKWLACL